MAIPKAALDLIIAFEGYIRRLPDDRAAPYLCPARVWTIGYGSIWLPTATGKTSVTAHTPPITRERATELLAWEIEKCERAVDAMISRPLPALSRGALVSFAYNCGAGALQRSSLRRVVNAGDWSRVPGEFAKWRMGGGVILPGLVRRRTAEAAMFMRGIQDGLAETRGDSRARVRESDGINSRGLHGWTINIQKAA